MSLIEKAVRRLDQLRRASGEAAPTPAPPTTKPPVREKVSGTGAGFKPVAPGELKPPPAQPVIVSRQVHIDLSRLAAMGLVTPDQPRSRIAEEFRVIKRPLLRNAQEQGPMAIKNGNLIMVTSALPGEGKSFSSINLAISMAMELDYRVLLVDADVSKPSVLSRLGLTNERGLMDVLSGKVDNLSDVLLRTNIEKLTILPAGMREQRATELLASEAMNRLVNQIATRYPDRLVIFDSPPLLVTTEARVLAMYMGQVMVIVEAGKTTHADVKHALATIENCPVKLMVLNKARDRAGRYDYGMYDEIETTSSEAAK